MLQTDKYLLLADTTLSFKNKKILEVGGCTPSELISKYDPLQWVSVDLNYSNVERCRNDKKKPNHIDYIYENICMYSGPDEEFDIVYSVNSFEHITDLKSALDNIYRVLKNNGHVFSVFGPIWSSHVGHHLSLNTQFGDLNFRNNILSPWMHLESKHKVYSEILTNYDKATAERAIHYIYHSYDINRLHLNHYQDLLKQAKLTKVCVLYNRSGPKDRRYSRVKEILWVLRKNHPFFLEKIYVHIKLIFGLFKILLRKYII